ADAIATTNIGDSGESPIRFITNMQYFCGVTLCLAPFPGNDDSNLCPGCGAPSGRRRGWGGPRRPVKWGEGARGGPGSRPPRRGVPPAALRRRRSNGAGVAPRPALAPKISEKRLCTPKFYVGGRCQKWTSVSILAARFWVHFRHSRSGGVA